MVCYVYCRCQGLYSLCAFGFLDRIGLAKDPELNTLTDLHCAVPQQGSKMMKTTTKGRTAWCPASQHPSSALHNMKCKQSCIKQYSFPSFRSLPTFTTVDHIWSRSRNRWMSGVEKLQALGFPMTDSVASTYGVVP